MRQAAHKRVVLGGGVCSFAQVPYRLTPSCLRKGPSLAEGTLLSQPCYHRNLCGRVLAATSSAVSLGSQQSLYEQGRVGWLTFRHSRSQTKDPVPCVCLGFCPLPSLVPGLPILNSQLSRANSVLPLRAVFCG